MISQNLLSAHWPAISALLDAGLALPVSERAGWLASLPGEHDELKGAVRQLLALDAQVETGEFLHTLPKLGVGAAVGMGVDAEPRAGENIGPYSLITLLGQGGMGTVWLAERADGQLKRQVALKLPRLAWGGALAQRLARERDILASLEHVNIARLYDAGVDGHGRPWLAMEYVEGQPIDVYCREHGLGVAARVALLLQVAAAVAHAHARLVVHRDLKPANILVTADGQVRLLDFGIAKLMEGERTAETALTQMSGRALTLDYASPEQIRGEPLGTASDVYSLAVVAYELLAGARPYRLKRASAAELEEAIASVDAPLASELAAEPALRRQLRGDLDAILNKALKKDSAQRYGTVEALAQDLVRYQVQQPVLAQADSLRYRVGKFVRRHRWPVASGAGVAAALVVGAAVALWQAQQARYQATRAQGEADALAIVGNFMLAAFSRLAADPAMTGAAGREAMADALRIELANTEAMHRDKAKALGEVYGNAAAMFNYLQSQPDSLAWSLKQLQQLRQANQAPSKIAEAERQIALAYYRGGDAEQALVHLDAGRAALPASRDESTRVDRSRLWRASGIYLESLGRVDQARAALEAAIAELEPDLRQRGHYHGSARMELARVLSTLGDDQQPLVMLQEVREVYARLPGLPESEWGGLELTQGVILLGLGRHGEAERSVRQAAALYAKQFGLSSPNAAGIDALIARAMLRQGRYAEAAALNQRARSMLLASPGFSNRSWLERTLYVQVDLELESGDLAAAASSVAQARQAVQERPMSARRALVAQAQLASALGRHDDARRLIAQAQPLTQQSLKDSMRNDRSLERVAAEIEFAAGRWAAAAARLQHVPVPVEGGADWNLLPAADLRAAVAWRLGDSAAALAWYRSPLARLADGTPSHRGRRDEALARMGFGQVLQTEGQAAEARLQFDRAAALLATQHADSPLRAAYAKLVAEALVAEVGPMSAK